MFLGSNSNSNDSGHVQPEYIKEDFVLPRCIFKISREFGLNVYDIHDIIRKIWFKLDQYGYTDVEKCLETSNIFQKNYGRILDLIDKQKEGLSKLRSPRRGESFL